MKLRTTILVALLFSSQTAFGQWFEQYKDLGEIYAELDALAAEFPDLVTPLTIGHSIEGREIRGVKIAGSNPSKPIRPAVLINGTQHAREWISPMTNMYMARQLVSGYGTSDEVTSLMDDVEHYVIPVVNPDGYVYSWTDDRFWRKNRRDNGDGTFGVDLNRNWDFQWGRNDGSSGDTSELTYRGTEPFSEPETRAMRDFFQDHQNIVATIDYHSYSQLILYPFGYDADAIADDEVLMRDLAIQMASSIEQVHAESYLPIPANQFYPVSGASLDWTYGAEGIYSFTIELRPISRFVNFDLPADQIIPTVEENWPALLDLGEFVTVLNSGDFNADGVFDCGDAAALGVAIQVSSNKAEFDLNGDGAISSADQLVWHENSGTRPGDANLDGQVDEADFAIWQTNAFSETTSLCQGDFNADGYVDVSDFNVWSTNRSVGAQVAVPEPHLFVCVFPVVVALLHRRKRIR